MRVVEITAEQFAAIVEDSGLSEPTVKRVLLAALRNGFEGCIRAVGFSPHTPLFPNAYSSLESYKYKILILGVTKVGKKRASAVHAEQKILWPEGFTLTPDRYLHAVSILAPIEQPAVAELWAAFELYHRGKGSRWAGLKGWEMAWRGWCRNEKRFNTRHRAAQPSRDGHEIDLARDYLDRRRGR